MELKRLAQFCDVKEAEWNGNYVDKSPSKRKAKNKERTKKKKTKKQEVSDSD